MTDTWRKRSGGRSCRGKGCAAVQYAAQKITSDHGNILPLDGTLTGGWGKTYQRGFLVANDANG